MKNTDLQRKITKTVEKLARLVDAIGPSPLRYAVDGYVVAIRLSLLAFDQDEYDDNEDYYLLPMFSEHSDVTSVITAELRDELRKQREKR